MQKPVEIKPSFGNILTKISRTNWNITENINDRLIQSFKVHGVPRRQFNYKKKKVRGENIPKCYLSNPIVTILLQTVK